MGFSKMMELLQKKEKGRIVFCNAGEFYVAIGKDAVLLNEILGLKVSCLKLEMCKVGFPINSLEKYTDLLMQKRYGYIVYFFNREKIKLEIIESYMGKNRNNIQLQNINCYKCKHKGKKFSMGTEYKLSLYQMLKNIMILSKIEKRYTIKYLNEIDSLLNTQRIYLRIMKKYKWIDEKKFKIAMEQIYEIGKILGGLIKYYAKNNKEQIL